MKSVFEQTIISLHGSAGADWLAGLPGLIAICEARWGLRVAAPFPNLSFNFAAPAERLDGTPVVLKLGVPNHELRSEMEALRFYDGHGSVRLLEATPDEGALLLERLRPGTMLSTVSDDEAATRTGARVMLKLWRPAPAQHNFPTVADWARGLNRLRVRFDGGTGPLPAPLVETAEHYFEELLASPEAPVLLHGDLHHFNILSAEREPWLALDPKGLVGEAAYEVGAFLYNPVGSYLAVPDPARKMERRVAILAEELGFDRQRVSMWGMAAAVLSAWWSIEGQGLVDEEVLQCAALLKRFV